MTTDPTAMPIERVAVNRLATSCVVVSTSFTSGGKMMMSTAPIVQKKLIAQIARNSRGTCSVALMRRHDEVNGLKWTRSRGPRRGAEGTSRPVHQPAAATASTTSAIHSTGT